MPFFENYPELSILVISALPFLEPRVAIPAAFAFSNLSPALIIGLAFLGNAAAIFLVAPILWKFGEALANQPHIGPILKRIFALTRKRHEKKFERAKDLALLTFIAIPLPLSGVWSGMLAAFVFGFSLRRAMILCLAGGFISALAVGITVSGIEGLLKL